MELGLAGAHVTEQQAVLGVKDTFEKETAARTAASEAAQFGIDQSDEVQGAELNTQAAILKVVQAAQERAAFELGPGTTAQEVAKAKTKATEQAIIDLANTVPGSITALQNLGYTVVTLPDGKQIVVTADTSQAVKAIQDLVDKVTDGIDTVASISFGPSGRSRRRPRRPRRPRWLAPLAGSPRGLTVAGLAAPAPMRAVAEHAAALHVTVNITAAGSAPSTPRFARHRHGAARLVARNGPVSDVVERHDVAAGRAVAGHEGRRDGRARLSVGHVDAAVHPCTLRQAGRSR